MRELEQDVRAKDAAKAVYDLTVAESKSEGLRTGEADRDEDLPVRFGRAKGHGSTLAPKPSATSQNRTSGA